MKLRKSSKKQFSKAQQKEIEEQNRTKKKKKKKENLNLPYNISFFFFFHAGAYSTTQHPTFWDYLLLNTNSTTYQIGKRDRENVCGGEGE